MIGSLLLGSPLFWSAAAILVALLLTLLLFRTDIRLRRRMSRFTRRVGDIRVPACTMSAAPGPVRATADRALVEANAGRYFEAAVLFDRAAEYSTGTARAELTNLAGVCFYLAGRSEKAVEYYLRAAELAEAVGTKAVQASGFANLALLRLVRNEPELAHAAQEQALALDRETGDRVSVAVGLGRLGLTWQARGDAVRALDLHLEALALNRESGNIRGAACDLGRIGLAWQVLGEREKAHEYYREGYAAARKAGDRVAEAELMGNTGLLQLEQGENEQALTSLLGALALFGKMKDTVRAVNTVGGLRLARERLGVEEFAAGCRRFGVNPRELARLEELLDRLGNRNSPGQEDGQTLRSADGGQP